VLHGVIFYSFLKAKKAVETETLNFLSDIFYYRDGEVSFILKRQLLVINIPSHGKF
jgi:hypothetical protein